LPKKNNKVQIKDLQELIKQLIRIKEHAKSPELLASIDKEIFAINKRQFALEHGKIHDSLKKNGGINQHNKEK